VSDAAATPRPVRDDLPARLADVPDHIEVTCPRCQSTSTAAFYGPCERCRAELRAAYAGEARDVEAVAYEPKMNVTPNAVALKDD
jgi:hypothetical protein